MFPSQSQTEDLIHTNDETIHSYRPGHRVRENSNFAITSPGTFLSGHDLKKRKKRREKKKEKITKENSNVIIMITLTASGSLHPIVLYLI